jgi:hypothetical protein
MTADKLPPAAHNVIRQRGGPTEVTLSSGHKVEKQEYVFFLMPNAEASGPGDWRMVKCAEYHGAHFVYLDPLYIEASKPVDPNKSDTGRGHWFAMCTCGSPAVIVGPVEASKEDTNCKEQLLVCVYYHNTLVIEGWGKHADEEGRRRWS